MIEPGMNWRLYWERMTANASGQSCVRFVRVGERWRIEQLQALDLAKDFIKKAKSMDADTFDAQWLCRRPNRDRKSVV